MYIRVLDGSFLYYGVPRIKYILITSIQNKTKTLKKINIRDIT